VTTCLFRPTDHRVQTDLTDKTMLRFRKIDICVFRMALKTVCGVRGMPKLATKYVPRVFIFKIKLYIIITCTERILFDAHEIVFRELISV